MEKELTLRERYEQINQLILETKPQRAKFTEVSEELIKKSKSYSICSRIMEELRLIYLKPYKDTSVGFDELRVSNLIEIRLCSHEIGRSGIDIEEIEKILEEYSPEKVKIIGLKKDIYTSESYIMEIELV